MAAGVIRIEGAFMWFTMMPSSFKAHIAAAVKLLVNRPPGAEGVG
jgi:hypothetical protein